MSSIEKATRKNHKIFFNCTNICDVLRDLVPFVQLKNVKNTPPWVFFTFFNRTNCTKSRNASHIVRTLPKVYDGSVFQK